MDELVSEYTIVIVTHNMQQAARVSDRTGFFTVAEGRERRITGSGSWSNSTRRTPSSPTPVMIGPRPT